VARYVYEGQHPEEDPAGQLVRPLDVREYDAPPPWGAWRQLDDADPQAPPEPPRAVPPPATPPAPVTPPLPATGTEG
jgi:hypothetical protein